MLSDDPRVRSEHVSVRTQLVFFSFAFASGLGMISLASSECMCTHMPMGMLMRRNVYEFVYAFVYVLIIFAGIIFADLDK